METMPAGGELLPRLVAAGNLKSAWERVLANQGCAGVDAVSCGAFGRLLDQNLENLGRDISDGSYRPLPLLRILVAKGNGESRPLSVPAVRDRVAQAAALGVLGPVFEKEFEQCSYGYRKGRSWREAVRKVLDYYDAGYRWVLEADIDAFFDSVPHSRLLDKVDRLVEDQAMCRLMSLWVKATVWDGATLEPVKLGIPQGSVVSPMLANLYLDELDEELLARGMRLVRYADDFVVLCKTKEKANEAAELTGEILRKMSLHLDEADIVHFDQGFRFLGVTFCRSMALVPFERQKKIRKVIHMPPFMDDKLLTLLGYRD